MRRSGFTLIEILLVLSITGMLAGVLLPRISFYFEPHSAVLQRAVEEAGDTALSGLPVRLYVKPEGSSGRGRIVAEALHKREMPPDSLSVFLGTNVNMPTVLEWRNLEMRNLPDGNGWKFEPDMIYFYRDGSCSPAKISWKDENLPESGADNYLLTVTGYCAILED